MSLIISTADICFNPRGLAGGRDLSGSTKYDSYGVSIRAYSREDATDFITV